MRPLLMRKSSSMSGLRYRTSRCLGKDMVGAKELMKELNGMQVEVVMNGEKAESTVCLTRLVSTTN